MPFCAPQIVYSNSWLGKTSAISAETAFTLTQPGLFRITATLYVVLSSGGYYEVDGTLTVANAPSISIGINQQYGVPSDALASTAVYAGVSGVNVVLNTTLTGGTGTLNHYDVYVVVEQLV